MSEMKKDSIAVFNSNDIYPIGADSTFPFEQHRDIFYLTGIDQEETILLLSPEAKEIKNREILFVKKNNLEVKLWKIDIMLKFVGHQTANNQRVM